MKRPALTWLILIAICMPSLAAARSTVRISGSATLAPVIERAVEDMAQSRRTKIKAKIDVSDSMTGLKDLINGKADLCLMSREIPQEIIRDYPEHDFKVLHIARDAVVPVVSFNIFMGDVHSLSIKELVDIYKGKIKNWSEVGGPDATIHIIEQKMTSGTFFTFINGIFQNEPYSPSATQFSMAGTRTNADIHDLVMESTGAIAALPVRWTSQHVRAVGVKTKKGILYPIPELVRSDLYPTARYLSLVTIGEPSEDVQKLMDFLMSSEGQKRTEEEKFVPMFLRQLTLSH